MAGVRFPVREVSFCTFFFEVVYYMALLSVDAFSIEGELAETFMKDCGNYSSARESGPR